MVLGDCSEEVTSRRTASVIGMDRVRSQTFSSSMRVIVAEVRMWVDWMRVVAAVGRQSVPMSDGQSLSKETNRCRERRRRGNQKSRSQQTEE